MSLHDEINIHDNEVLSYRLLLPMRQLIMETTYQSEKTDIIFDDVLAYSFEDAGDQNIIFEAVESSLNGFIDWYAGNNDKQNPFEFGLPVQGTPDELKQFLNEQGYHYYEINASVGLDGFVIAKGMTFAKRDT